MAAAPPPAAPLTPAQQRQAIQNWMLPRKAPGSPNSISPRALFASPLPATRAQNRTTVAAIQVPNDQPPPGAAPLANQPVQVRAARDAIQQFDATTYPHFELDPTPTVHIIPTWDYIRWATHRMMYDIVHNWPTTEVMDSPVFQSKTGLHMRHSIQWDQVAAACVVVARMGFGMIPFQENENMNTLADRLDFENGNNNAAHIKNMFVIPVISLFIQQTRPGAGQVETLDTMTSHCLLNFER